MVFGHLRSTYTPTRKLDIWFIFSSIVCRILVGIFHVMHGAFHAHGPEKAFHFR